MEEARLFFTRRLNLSYVGKVMGKVKKFQSKLTKKGSGGKDQTAPKNVFHVKPLKATRAKHRTKAVTTTLSKVIGQMKPGHSSAMKINKEYSDLQDTLHRSIPAKEKNQQIPVTQSRDVSSTSVDIDETTEQLSSL